MGWITIGRVPPMELRFVTAIEKDRARENESRLPTEDIVVDGINFTEVAKECSDKVLDQHGRVEIMMLSLEMSTWLIGHMRTTGSKVVSDADIDSILKIYIDKIHTAAKQRLSRLRNSGLLRAAGVSIESGVYRAGDND